ncbi:MAG: FG-GAP repeat protein [Proteobacteria bacterium]|nr:FG-GAP repeat protein [Pseudomonadota bacterium]
MAVSADGNVMAIGAPGESSGFQGVDNDNEPVIDSDSPSELGVAVSLSGVGSVLAVGAPSEIWTVGGINGTIASPRRRPSGENAAVGAVYTFVQGEGASDWSQQSYITSSSVHCNPDMFGYSLAPSGDGDTLVIGAPGDSGSYTGLSTRSHVRMPTPDDSSHQDSGAVYLH